MRVRLESDSTREAAGKLHIDTKYGGTWDPAHNLAAPTHSLCLVSDECADIDTGAPQQLDNVPAEEV